MTDGFLVMDKPPGITSHDVGTPSACSRKRWSARFRQRRRVDGKR